MRLALAPALALLCWGCSSTSFIESDTYQAALPVVGFAPGTAPEFAYADAKAGDEFDRVAAAMLIRRRHLGLYDNPTVLINYLWAVREELAMYRERGDGIRTRFPDGVEGLVEMQSYFESGWAHTQQRPEFDKYPGDDPWGRADGTVVPEYKKLLPSEMIAMSMYTGRITGKCTTLSAAMGGIIALAGSGRIDPEDILLLRKEGHTLGLWKTGDGRILVFNNTHLNQVGPRYVEYMQSERYTHFFGYGFYARCDVQVPSDLLEGEDTLREMFERASGTTAARVDREPILVDYALQKLSVPDPSLYVEVSAQLPHTRHLSHRLEGIGDILAWIRQTLADGSIFADSRVMTSDQVIVFKTGNPIDKAVLLCALLANQGGQAAIETLDGRVTVRTDDALIDMDELQVTRR